MASRQYYNTHRKCLTPKKIANAIVLQVPKALLRRPNKGRHHMSCESFKESKSCQTICMVIW